MKTDEKKTTGTVKVMLARPGVRACGPYQAGKAYDVPAEEAARLIEHKGFKKVSGADKPAPAEQYIKG